MLSYMLTQLQILFVFIVRGYIFWFIDTAIILIFLISLIWLSTPESRFNYYIKIVFSYLSFLLVSGLLIPIFICRPKDLRNVRLSASIVHRVSSVLGITFELRGADLIRKDEGALVCLNHQSSMDFFTLSSISEQLNSFTIIAKTGLFYFFPFGQALWLSGVVFISRSSKSSFHTLSTCGEFIKKIKAKVIIFPEGTRNKNNGLLPFKKGAFITAIQAQIPIYPIVASPYEFLDHEKKIFRNKGHVIISVLPPIPTVGMTMNDVDKLLNQTRDIMLLEYEKLYKEVQEESEKWSLVDWPRLTLKNYKMD